MKIKVKEIIPKNWKFKENNDLITIWYENHNKNPTPVTLKKEIEVSEDLGILLGFWAGDGSKRSFVLTNNNLQVISKLYKIVNKNLNLNEISLRINIPVNFKDLEPEILKEAKNVFPEIEKIKTAPYHKNRSKPIYHLINNKVITIKFIKLLYNYILFNMNRYHEYWDGYLKGTIAAEGHMELRKHYNSLSRVSIAQTSNNFRKSIIKALKARNIEYSIDKKYIRISGKNDFEIILKKKLYDLHPKKEKQFIIGFNNIKQHHYSIEEAERLILNELKAPKRVSSIAKKIKRGRQNVREHLLLKDNSFLKRKLIEKSGKQRGARGSFYGDLWKLSTEGFKYSESLKK